MAERSLSTRSPRQFPPLVVEQLERIEADLGGRHELVGLLTLAPLNPDLRYILGLLGDPRNDRKTLAAICAQGNVLPGELMKHLGSAALLRGKVLASQQIGNGIAATVADIMKKAAPYEATCYQCRGIGTYTPEPTREVPNPGPGPCDLCGSMGVLQYQPDLDRQRLAIEMAQLLPKGGGLQILNQLNAGGPPGSSGGGGPLEQLQALTDQILYGSGPVGPPVEGEAAPATEGELLETDPDAPPVP